jgi:predicted PurR-regulated permease PerM
MKKDAWVVILVVLLFLLIPLTNVAAIAVPGQDPSPVDDFGQWFENALEDVRVFIDNLGENLSRTLEELFSSVRNLGEALGDQLGEAVEGIQQE